MNREIEIPYKTFLYRCLVLSLTRCIFSKNRSIINPNYFPPLNAICIIWGEDQGGRIERIQTIRIERENGKAFRVKEAWQHTRHLEGRTNQHQFAVGTKEDSYLEIWLDL